MSWLEVAWILVRYGVPYTLAILAIAHLIYVNITPKEER